ncbi:phytoene desaturase family protein [Sporosarcina aquimarina]|uniref:Phytoene desaturase family protein n=1 Tax=Sporosarcina aquimarina TaxID=114975 RepID=A0ABU4G2Y5_9BACL|nr:phytoene desaturase family protein [Sporosarcina aquimarina]MDW0111266.1 phytoene desaturase family protein [Sporosarcina aquimarina]
MKKKIIVIGAGTAGLASAIRLQHAGYQVDLYEKESTPGGKMNRIEMDGYRFDLGPTLVMMPDIYKEVFIHCGRNPDDYIPMEKLDPMYRVYFSNDPTHPINVSSDLISWTQTLESFSPDDAAGFLSYLSDIYKGYTVAMENIIQRPFRKKSDFYNLSMLKKGMNMKVSGSANQFLGNYIKDERLKQIISFQTLYIGISPIKSPSFYTMIPMIQFLYGIWFIKGGMYTMATSMERLFKELGGTVHYNSPIDEILIENKQAIGVRIDKRRISADYVVCNADFPYAMKHLIQDKQAKGRYTDRKIDHMNYSCSTMVMYLGMIRKYDEIEHIHNFVFDVDLEKNMNDIFEGNKLTKASFYVYIASKMDASLAPAGKDGLYIMMPVSNVATSKYEWDEYTIAEYRTYILNTLKSIKGFENIENEIVTEKCFTPLDFESKFNAFNGAAFGLLPTLLQSSHLRPQSKAKNCSNLYFNGSSTHPGAGVPIVLMSAKIAAQELIQDDQGILFGY